MTFLQPFLLLFAALISVPFIIHLLGERKYRPFSFSSLKFLREIERESLQKLKLRQWLILITRALAISMLVLALAKPYLSGKSGAFEPGILLVDNSFSTRQNEEFSRIKNDLREEFTRWHMIEYSEHSSTDTLKAEITAYIQEHRLSAPHILVLSDFQDNTTTRSIINIIRELSIKPFYIPVYKKSPNTAITGLQLFYDLSDTEAMYTLDIRVSAAPADREIFPLYVNVNGKNLGRAEVSQDGHAYFRFAPENNEFIRCVVRASPDDYPGDNTRYLVANRHGRIKLLCVSEYENSGYHINAFRAMDRIEMQIIKPGDLPSINPADYDIIWLSDMYELPGRQQQAMMEYAEKHPLFLVAGNEISDNSSWRSIHGEFTHKDNRPGFATISSMKNAVQPETVDLKSFRIQQYYRSSAEDLYPLWVLSNGDPLLARKGEFIHIFFSPFLFNWNEMGLSPYFTAALNRLLQTALQEKEPEYHTGDIITLEGPQSEITTPSGEKHRVHEKFTATDTPGFYTIRSNEREREIAVNIPGGECIQRKYETDTANTYYPQENNIKDVRRAVKGQNIQTLFFILAALFVILEMLLLRKGEKTSS